MQHRPCEGRLFWKSRSQDRFPMLAYIMACIMLHDEYKKFLRMSSQMDLRQKKASANRAFDLSNVLHQLTEAQQRFQVTHQITEPAVKRAARKWKRMAQIKIKEVSQ